MAVKKYTLKCGGKWTAVTFGPMLRGDYCPSLKIVYCGDGIRDHEPTKFDTWYRPYDQDAKRVVFTQEAL